MFPPRWKRCSSVHSSSASSLPLPLEKCTTPSLSFFLFPWLWQPGQRRLLPHDVQTQNVFTWAQGWLSFVFFNFFPIHILPIIITKKHSTINIFDNFLERQKGKAFGVSYWTSPIWCSYHLLGLWTFYELQHLSISTVKSTDGFWYFIACCCQGYTLNSYMPSSPANILLSK